MCPSPAVAQSSSNAIYESVSRYRNRQRLAARSLLIVVAVTLVGLCAGCPSNTTSVLEQRLTFSILEDYDKGEDLGGVEQDFALFRDLGIDTWGGSFGWDISATRPIVIPFHAYPEIWTAPDVDVENYLGGLSAFLSAADAACGRRPIWINEAGFATIEGRTEEQQAAWWARAIATFAAEPRIEDIGVYEIKDLAAGRPAIGGAPDYHLGITRSDRTRKLAFQTVAMLVSALGHELSQSFRMSRAAGSGQLRAAASCSTCSDFTTAVVW